MKLQYCKLHIWPTSSHQEFLSKTVHTYIIQIPFLLAQLHNHYNPLGWTRHMLSATVKAIWSNIRSRYHRINYTSYINGTKESHTLAIADVITSGMGSVVSPIPRLITFASGYFCKCAFLLLAIYFIRKMKPTRNIGSSKLIKTKGKYIY